MKKQAHKRGRPSKKVQATQVSRLWRVSRTSHTGHVLPHRHTSYPVLIMILLCTGVLLTGWTRAVNAANSGSGDYRVTASVTGPTPTVAATIDKPLDNTTVESKPITVVGSCPSQTYVELLRNGSFSGTTICEANGSYHVSTDLYLGANQLVVKVYNFAHQAGPLSNKITVVYDPTKPAQSSAAETKTQAEASTQSEATKSKPGTAETPTAAVSPLTLKTDYRFQGFYVGQSAGFSAFIDGGNPAYAVAVDWGDGQHDLLSRSHSGELDLMHTYHQHGGYKGNYVVTLTATDANGATTSLQLVIIVNQPPVNSNGNTNGLLGGLLGGPNSGGGTASQLQQIMKYVWPSYGVTLAMVGSFWLGEMRELKYLRPHLRAGHRLAKIK